MNSQIVNAFNEMSRLSQQCLLNYIYYLHEFVRDNKADCVCSPDDKCEVCENFESMTPVLAHLTTLLEKEVKKDAMRQMQG